MGLGIKHQATITQPSTVQTITHPRHPYVRRLPREAKKIHEKKKEKTLLIAYLPTAIIPRGASEGGALRQRTRVQKLLIGDL